MDIVQKSEDDSDTEAPNLIANELEAMFSTGTKHSNLKKWKRMDKTERD